MERRLKTARTMCAGAALILAALWGLWYGWLQPAEENPLMVAILGVAPLILFIPGILGGRTLATAAAGFFALLYMAHGIMELVANPEIRNLAIVFTLGSLMLFFTASYALRTQQRNARSTE